MTEQTETRVVKLTLPISYWRYLEDISKAWGVKGCAKPVSSMIYEIIRDDTEAEKQKAA